MFSNFSDVTCDSIDVYKEEVRDLHEIVFENDLQDLICLQFGLSEQTYMRLVECGIDIESLLFIKEEDMKEIFPTNMLGQRIKFRSRVFEWQQQNRLRKPTPSTRNIMRPIRTVSPTPSTQTHTQSQRTFPCIPSPSPNNSITAPLSPSSNRVDEEKIPLTDLLRTSLKGQLILKFFEENNKLLDEHRVGMVSAIVDYFKDRTIPMSIGAIIRFTEEIGTVFPSEEKRYYYNARGRGLNPVGKLYDKAINARRKIKKTFQEREMLESNGHANTKPTKPTETNYENVVPTSEDLERKSWLSQNFKPWDDVIYMWKKTFSIRRSQILSNENILHHWPLFKNPMGYQLIDIDFAELFPDKPSDLLSEWPHFRATVVPYFKDKIKDHDSKELMDKVNPSMSNDSIDCLLIYLIHAVIKPPLMSIKTNSPDANKKRKWKPSILEAQNATIMHCITTTDFQIKYEQLKFEASQRMKKLQPLLVVIGDELSNVEEFHVIYDCVLYTMPSFVKALDILFKIHYVMNMECRAETRYLHELIETYFFKIKNTSNPNVISLINQLNQNKS